MILSKLMTLAMAGPAMSAKGEPLEFCVDLSVFCVCNMNFAEHLSFI